MYLIVTHILEKHYELCDAEALFVFLDLLTYSTTRVRMLETYMRYLFPSQSLFKKKKTLTT